MSDTQPETTDLHAATAAIITKIQEAMSLFGDSHVGNLILREGTRLEYETSQNGRVAFVNFDSVTIGEHGSALESSGSVGDVLTREEMHALFNLVDKDWRVDIQSGGLDGPIRVEGMSRYRAHICLWGGEQHTYHDGLKGKMAAFIRIIPEEVVPLRSLGLPPYMSVLADANHGLMLITGPTGAGKTTTLTSFIDHINQTRVGHVITIEDPIEFELKERRCRITQREVGTNVRDLQTGVKDAMREIPLAIMVGETRDTDTLIQTMRASRSGHYVGTTKHAPNVVSAIRSLIDELPGESSANAVMVSETLLGVIYQARVPSTVNGQWEFAFECLNVTNNIQAQECIAKQDWHGLKSLMEGSDNVENKAQLLNRSLMNLVKENKVIEESADRCSYDRAGLRLAIQRTKSASGSQR